MDLQHQHRQALHQLLRSDIELYSDGGRKRAAGLKPLFGLDRVLKFLVGVRQLPAKQGNAFDYRPGFANGMPTALLFRRSTGELDSMASWVLEPSGIARLL